MAFRMGVLVRVIRPAVLSGLVATLIRQLVMAWLPWPRWGAWLRQEADSVARVKRDTGCPGVPEEVLVSRGRLELPTN
jgi:hypothetical protein